MDNQNRTGIMVAGTMLVDRIHTIASYPSCGELTQIQSNHMAVGGLVPNVGLDLKRIDPTLDVYGAGTIGDDDNGNFVINTLQQGGIDTTGLTVLPNEETSFTEVMSVPGGQRTFFTFAGTGAQFDATHLHYTDTSPKILHLGYFLLLKKVDEGEGQKILQAAQAQGIETSIDLVSEDSDRYGLVLPCLPYTDYLIINELEAGKLAGMEPTLANLHRIAQKLLELGVRKKVIIHMPECAVCLSHDGFTCVPSCDLPDGYIQGTTGAGDAFCAGALIGIYRGWTDTEILTFASECAVMALGSPDATSGMRSLSETREFCRPFPRKQISVL